jgi:ABC-2 type transport system ATP-binding protein
MGETAIVARGLLKRYGDTLAVDGIDLDVAANSIYALLGPNGAGKTTTINMLTTLVPPSAGSAQVAGYDVVDKADRVRERIGVTFQDIVLDRDLTGRQLLDIHGRLYRQSAGERRKRMADLVDLVQLNDVIDRRVNTYSGGMKRRLELARGLMTDPEVLFLDEPTQGLDPQNRVGIWEYVRRLNKERGLTVLLTTHYMDEAEDVAHQVGIIDHGKLIVSGTPASLVSNEGGDLLRITANGDLAAAAACFKQLAVVQSVEVLPDNKQIEVVLEHGNKHLAALLASSAQIDFQIEEILLSRPTLADVFLRYTGRALRD